uniref:C2H2-type domain-containing protein n=1 Tax=Acanthochromis polyacanthus TaxID=80966 RepID=A0A3Q1G532_9TELE
MKSTEVDQGLFTDSYCKVCSAQLISESQRVAHYEVKTPHHMTLTQGWGSLPPETLMDVTPEACSLLPVNT